jgi:ketosteroid isomerase-like protein
MSKQIETVKALNHAFTVKDAQAFRALLHDQYTFRGAMMNMDSPDEAAGMLANCPFKASHQNAQFHEAGDTVVQTFDWVVTEPIQETIRMCSVITFRDGKIFHEELFYDTAKFPEGALEAMKATT